MDRPPVDLLVVGATGLDGPYCLSAARKLGLNAVGTTRGQNAELYSTDPMNEGQYSECLDELQPKSIILLAGQSSVGRSFEEPRLTVRSHLQPLHHTLDWMRKSSPGTKLVYAGSGESFGPASPENPATEKSKFAPQNPYAAAKAMAALEIAAYRNAYSLNAMTAFLFNHEGPARRAQFVFGKILAGLKAAKSGEAIKPIELGDLSVIRDWGWAPDYCNAMVSMTQLKTPGDILLATGTSVSLEVAVRSLVSAAGYEFDDVIAERPDSNGHHFQNDAQYANPALAKQRLGWTGSTAFPDLAMKLIAGLQ